MTTAKPPKTPDDLNTRSLFFAELAINQINEHPNPQLGAVQWSILSDVFEAAIKDERERCAKIAESPSCHCKEADIHDGCCASCGSRIAKAIRGSQER